MAAVAAGAKIDARRDDGATALLLVAERGLMDAVEHLLAGGAGVDLAMDDGRTPLMSAAANGHEDIVRALLAAGAKVDVGSQTGWTPLMVAARSGHIEVVELLLDAGAELISNSSPPHRHPPAPAELIAASHPAPPLQPLTNPLPSQIDLIVEPRTRLQPTGAATDAHTNTLGGEIRPASGRPLPSGGALRAPKTQLQCPRGGPRFRVSARLSVLKPKLASTDAIASQRRTTATTSS